MTDVASREEATPHTPRFRKRKKGAADHTRTKLYVVSTVVFVALAAAGLAAGVAYRDSTAPELFTLDDSFDRTSENDLGAVDGRAWEVVSGSFAIDSGSAVVRHTNTAGPRTVAVTEISATNATITVTAGAITAGWGVVFRYVGPFNYWYIQAVPEFAVFNVVRMVNGQAQVVGRSRLANLEDGVLVQIVLRGPTIEVRVDDHPVFATNSNHGLGARKAGLITVGKAAGASWQRFQAEPDRANPGPTDITLSGAPVTTSTTTTPVVPPSSDEATDE